MNVELLMQVRRSRRLQRSAWTPPRPPTPKKS